MHEKCSNCGIALFSEINRGRCLECDGNVRDSRVRRVIKTVFYPLYAIANLFGPRSPLYGSTRLPLYDEPPSVRKVCNEAEPEIGEDYRMR